MERNCTIEGCDKSAISRAMCKRHYDQWWVKTPAKDRPLPQVELRQMTEIELAWVTGLIEGEGTFFCTKRRERRYPVVAVGMTDKDVIEKLYLLVGAGDIFITTVRGLMKKTRYTWKLSRSADVLALAKLLEPHMGVRRREQIAQMFEQTSLRYIEANL